MKKKMLLITLLAGSVVPLVKAQVGVNTPNPGSTLTVNGSFAAPYKIVTTSGTVGSGDYYIAYNGSADGTLTLPAAITGTGNFAGRTYHFKTQAQQSLP
jgi:hypothetical protein